MKCLACDSILSDRAATRKFAGSGTFVDLCDDCYETIAEDVEVVDNPHLSNQTYETTEIVEGES